MSETKTARTATRELRSLLSGVAITLAALSLARAVPPWWACWLPVALAWITLAVAGRLDRRARQTTTVINGSPVDYESVARQVREAIRRSNGGAR